MQDYAATNYPAPPWRLAGPAAIAMGTVDVERARPLVPDDLEIVEVRPGKTVAGFVIADYQRRATFPYSELSVMAAMVRCRGIRGPWISNIWVDSLPSLKGGREMWGLYKHQATFDWTFGPTTSVAVTAQDQRLVTFTWAPPQRLWPAPAWVRGIGSVDGDRRRYTGRGISRLGRTQVEMDVPVDSPIAELGLHTQPLRTVAGQMNLLFGDVRILAPPRAAAVTPVPAAPSEQTT
jgi:hypothetical protein